MRELGQQAADGAHQTLGPVSSFEGKLTFEGQVRIEGTFTGEITTNDLLIIGQHAKVSAEISCGSVVVTGEVTGNIRATDVVELREHARVKADIATPALVIDKGVVWDGNCTMGGGAPRALVDRGGATQGSADGGTAASYREERRRWRGRAKDLER